MAAAPEIFDRALVRERRRRAYAQAARSGQPVPDFLLARVADDFAERLTLVKRQFAAAACVGAYHGVLSRHLAGLPNVAAMTDVEAVDLAMAASGATATGAPRIVADEERLPFAPHSLDLIVSGLSWQLTNDLPGVFVQAQRALKPDGLLLAAILGGQTLRELREAWLVAEEEVSGGASPRVAPFADVRELGALLQRAGFALPVADADVVTVTYATPLALMAELKAMGASNMLATRRRVPVTRTLLLRAAEVYAERFGLPNGRVPATFEIITLTGWVPHESQQKPLRPGSAEVSLADILTPRREDPAAKE